MAKKIKSYKLEALPPIMRRLIEFKPVPNVPYMNRYENFFDDQDVIEGAEEYLAHPTGPTFEDNKYLATLRALFKTDPFFIVHIAMGNPFANDERGFVNKMCAHALHDLNCHYDGLNSLYLDVWAREHYKSSIKTRTIPLLHIFNNPTDTVLIQAANVKLAQTLMNPIKKVMEMPETRFAFSDILFTDMKDARKWTENELLINTDNARGENTFEISGLLEGQKIGRHYNMILSDDVETLDLARNPEQLEKLKEAYYYSISMMAQKTFINVVGTYYSHLGLLVELRDQVWRDTGEYTYNYRKVPYRNKNGELVLFDEAKARIIEQDRASCRTQYELDPTPKRDAQFSSEDIKDINPNDIPKNLFTVILIDPAGNFTQNGDPWCVSTLGFRPNAKNCEEDDIFILDMDLEQMTEKHARHSISRQYGSHGLIRGVGYEHMGQGDYFGRDVIAVIKAEHGVELKEDWTLVKLFPQGRGNKKTHIERTLAPALREGRVYMSTAISHEVRRKFKTEIDTHPVGRDDGMDTVSYYKMALDKLQYALKRNSLISDRKIINIRDRKDDYNLGGHPQAWMAR